MLRRASLIMQGPAKPCSLVVNSVSPWDSEGGHASRAATHPVLRLLWRKWFALMLSGWRALQRIIVASLLFSFFFFRSARHAVTFCSFRNTWLFRPPIKSSRLAAREFDTGLQTRGLGTSKLILRNKDTAFLFYCYSWGEGKWRI